MFDLLYQSRKSKLDLITFMTSDPCPSASEHHREIILMSLWSPMIYLYCTENHFSLAQRSKSWSNWLQINRLKRREGLNFPYFKDGLYFQINQWTHFKSLVTDSPFVKKWICLQNWFGLNLFWLFRRRKKTNNNNQCTF